MAKIEIDGKQLEVRDGIMLIQAADEAGIYIPRFCYHEKLSVAANCRMCMVDVEKAPKPLPACATPVTDGMVVRTASERAVDAQKGTMEFLLINHPLDCPICDQGGECPLQDQALGYGKDVSRFTEKKRVVEDKDIGPLIETSMTRCIHCTRCIRFGREIGGIMELGAVGRGEHMEITAYLGNTVDSEVSGNMIDLCPVGALTSKPYRFSARAWEMRNHDAISPHDCVGANMQVQTLRDEVKRVLPRSNEPVNQCWLSDRDRFSYEAVNSAERAVVPMLRSGDRYEPTDWKVALERVGRGLRNIIDEHGADSIAGLISPAVSTEEQFLFQKVLRGLGCDNIDHRLRQQDFADDLHVGDYPGASGQLADLDAAKAVLLVGSNVRKEQPLIGVRLRGAVRNGSRVFAVNAMDYDFKFAVADKAIVDPAALPGALARVAAAMASELGMAVPAEIHAWANTAVATASHDVIARAILDGGKESVIVLGDGARQHPRASVLRGIANWMHEQSGAGRMDLAEANSAGAWLAGCVPHRGPGGRRLEQGGLNAGAVLARPRRGYVLYGIDAELDCLQGSRLADALSRADFVVSLTAFRSESMNHADVVLPIAPYTESAGTYVNVDGRVQQGRAAVRPRGEARPGWKVLRVLGNQFNLDGFEQVTIDDVRSELGLSERLPQPVFATAPLTSPGDEDSGTAQNEFHHVIDVPLYRIDAYTRRAPALQRTTDNPQRPAGGLNPAQFERLGLRDGAIMNLVTPDGDGVSLAVHADPRVPPNCIHVPSGYRHSAVLGGARRLALEEV